VGVGVPQMPRAVMNQRIRAWQTGWQKAILQQAAAGQSQAIKAEAHWHTKTQEMLLKEWQAMMEGSADPDQRKALALTLARLLQRNAAEPATRERLSGDTLRMLDSLPEWLGK
jgi:hypothetical protein